MWHYGPPWPLTSSRMVLFFLFLLASHLQKASAKVPELGFDNCLTPTAGQTQVFTPTSVHADFIAPNYDLNIEVTGNMTGSLLNVNTDTNTLATLIAEVDTLQYRTYRRGLAFCNQTECPFTGPDVSFSLSIPLGSSYAFTTLDTTLRFVNPAVTQVTVGCIHIPITPYLGLELSNVLTFVPVGILGAVTIATILACVYNPWTGTTDMLRWTSNYGFDADMLRLATPGPSDVLLHFQFIFFSGALSLDYPGFYQPIVSKVGWSALAFNSSLVSHDPTTFANGLLTDPERALGLTVLLHYIGISSTADLWAIFVIAFIGTVCILIILLEIALIYRFLLHKDPFHDFRRKNPAFSFGIFVRCYLNIFVVPWTAYSFYQLVTTPGTSIAVTVVCAILLLALLLFAVFVIRKIALSRPRARLYDDIYTVLAYGGLYNTCLESAVTFSAFTMLTLVLRGIVIGAAQRSGIAQVVLLAIFEVVFLIGLHIFRPHHPRSNMNGFQTVFSVCRLLTWLFWVTFIPSLGISEAVRGWIGYVVLVLHGFLLIFAFFFNALSTMIELFARMAGAGDSTTRGGFGKVFGIHQLSRRHETDERPSIASEAVLLSDTATIESPTTPNFYRPPRRPTVSSIEYVQSSTSRSMSRQTNGGGTSSLRNSAYFDEWFGEEQTRPKDYAVRESDVYYHTQQPLSQQSGRKIRTGPADPNGAMAGMKRVVGRWFQRREEPAFEVVRSRPVVDEEGYPRRSSITGGSVEGSNSDLQKISRLKSSQSLAGAESVIEPIMEGDDDEAVITAEIQPPQFRALQSRESVREDVRDDLDDRLLTSSYAPILPSVDVGELTLSRDPSAADLLASNEDLSTRPNVPRKSSRRNELSTNSTPDLSALMRPKSHSSMYQAGHDVFAQTLLGREVGGRVSVESGRYPGNTFAENRHSHPRRGSVASISVDGSRIRSQHGHRRSLSREERMAMSLDDLRIHTQQQSNSPYMSQPDIAAYYQSVEDLLMQESPAVFRSRASSNASRLSQIRPESRRSREWLGMEI